MDTFNYKKYKNCYFTVASYEANPNAIAFSIENQENGLIATCTIFIGHTTYMDSLATIKNYSENSGITKFLQKLGIVTNIFFREPCNCLTIGTLDTKNPQTIDTVLIDMDKLKQYSKEWYYDV